MPTRFKRDAIALFGLAAVLAFTKYNLARLPVRPFGLDPCDAVNVFAFITIMMVAVVSLFRAFGPYSQAPSSAATHLRHPVAAGVCPRGLHHTRSECGRSGKAPIDVGRLGVAYSNACMA